MKLLNINLETIKYFPVEDVDEEEGDDVEVNQSVWSNSGEVIMVLVTEQK